MTTEKPGNIQGDMRGVMYDIFDADKAAEMTVRSDALIGLQEWFARTGMTQEAAANLLGVTQARVSEMKRGKIKHFSLDLLVRLAARAGLEPKLTLKLAA